MKTLKREQIRKEDKWNVEELYSNLEAWYADFQKIGLLDERPHWPELQEFKGKLGDGAQILADFLKKELQLDQDLSRLYTYAHLRADEDLANDEHKQAYAKITALFHDFSEELSFARPEILGLPDETLQKYLEDPILEPYLLLLHRIIRQKPHTLSTDKEALLAQAGQALSTPSNTFSALNDADMTFPPAVNAKGEELELTHGKFAVYIRDQDRTLRESAFKTFHKQFASFENTLAELLKGKVQSHLFNARARGYKSCLVAALFPHEIDPEVYHNLIATTREHLPSLHNYMALRKKLLGVDELHLYDLHVPVIPGVDLAYPFEEASKIVSDSVSLLGKPYQEVLAKGLASDRWVDRYENKHKRSGAYSSGCFESMPYILMNYQDQYSDLKTLAHEAGHSMHSYLSHKNQPYAYSHYPIFLAEVASTFNEELAFTHLLGGNLSREQKAYLVNQKIDDIRATFFRQTMFAEFELFIHTLAENNQPITPQVLKEKYLQLNKDYFGPHVVVDQEIEIEWGRIPHFYYNFYVYQYATGISAAHALFDRVATHTPNAVEDYLIFLSSGSCKPPLDILETAGVNMRQKDATLAMIQHFDKLVQELETLTK